MRVLFVAFTLIALGLGYVGTYVSRSLQGRYEPGVIGAGGVKWYEWAPRGFVSEFKWNATLMRIYYPLWIVDTRYWHKSDDAWKAKYPVNEVGDEDIWKVYKAWENIE